MSLGKKAVEYDIYLPLFLNNGRAVSATYIRAIKSQLVETFGGLTDFKHRNEGLWKVGNITFRDAIIILRVVSFEGKQSDKFFSSLKKKLRIQLKQSDILIVKRSIQVI